MKGPVSACFATLSLLVIGCATLMPYKSNSEAAIYTTEPDEMTAVSFVKPVLADKPGAGYYFYFSVKNGKKGPLRAVFETWNQDWVFADGLLIKVDDKLFTVAIPNSEWHRRVIPGSTYTPTMCAERADVSLGETHPEVVEAMCSGTAITVRFVGKDAQRTLNNELPTFIESVRLVCRAYGAKPARPRL